jgi:hypothetical protein
MATLRIQLLFHWDSKDATSLARFLYKTFSARPTGDGPRIPVRYGPKLSNGGPAEVELTAENEILVILADGRMARRARTSDRVVADQWGELVSGLVRDHGPGSSSPHRVLPVALDQGGLGLAPALNDASFVRLDVLTGIARERHLILHVAIRALRALRNLAKSPHVGQPVNNLPDIPVRLFVSHAKKDLPRDPSALAEGPVKAILSSLAQLPIEGWYDAAEIPPGGRFPEEIEKGVLNASAVVVVVTDSWSSREWCRREVLEAKLAGRPLVVVDALEARVIRQFPYLGNATTLRWRAAIAGPDQPAGPSWAEQRRRWEAEDAALVIEAALLEALRYQHDYARLLPLLKENDIALGTPPEALTLNHLPAGTKRVWYPDPPLGREELERLQPKSGAGSREQPDLITPLGELARWQPPAGAQPVAVSLSNSEDTASYGGSLDHLARFAEDTLLYLLLAGLRIAYGGALGHGALRNGAVEGDDIDYVERLFGVARSYSTLRADMAAASPPSPIVNWVAWPLHLNYGDDEYRKYGQEAELIDLPAPPDLDVGADELRASAKGYFPPDTPARRYAFARSLTFMRNSMRAGTSARILMGGQLRRYSGLLPGVLEEGVISLRTHQPLYPLGLFGGAARLLIDGLRGMDREELTTGWVARTVEGWSDLKQEYEQRGHAITVPEKIADELESMGSAGMAKVLNNGLTDEQNEELIGSDDPQQVVGLILEGLRKRLTS